MSGLTLGSLFDGIGGFPLAAVRSGIQPLWASEIEAFPIEVTKYHFPDMIHDERFINLIEKFLKTGYLEDWVFHKTYSGTPQGGIISPILSNIYLNELDKFMNTYKNRFDMGSKRKRNTQYRTISKRLCKARKNLSANWETMSEQERKDSKKNIRQLEIALLQEQPTLPQDSGYRRLQYVRYADDFIIGVIGSKADAKKIKQDLTVFLKEHLMLELSQEKTMITNSRDKARFLGYDIRVKRDQNITRLTDGTFSVRTI